MPVRRLHQPARLIADDRRAGDGGVDGAQLPDELPGPVTVPGVNGRVDQHEQAPAGADELSRQVGWQLAHRHVPRGEIVLQRAELRRKVVAQARLDLCEAGRQLSVATLQPAEESVRPVARRAQRCRCRPSLGLHRGDRETVAQRGQRGPDRGHVDGRLVAEVDVRHQRGQAPHGGDLCVLVGGDELEHAHQLGHGRERGKGLLLRLQLGERVGGGESRESGAA